MLSYPQIQICGSFQCNISQPQKQIHFTRSYFLMKFLFFLLRIFFLLLTTGDDSHDGGELALR